MTDPFSMDGTAMHLAAKEWINRYNAIVIGPNTRAIVAAVCVDIELQAKLMIAFEDLRAQVLADVCAKVLGPGFDPWSTVEALLESMSTGGHPGFDPWATIEDLQRGPVSLVVKIAARPLFVLAAICLYTNKGPSSLASSFGQWITCGSLGRLVRRKNMS